MAYLVRHTLDPRWQVIFDAAPGEPRIQERFHRPEPFSPDEVPKRIIQVSRHKTEVDFFHAGGVLCVSEAFRDIVEAHEPGLHQFLPLQAFRKNGEPLAKSYFVFHVQQFIDAVIPERSNVRWHYAIRPDLNDVKTWEWRNAPADRPPDASDRRLEFKNGHFIAVLDRRKIADKHVWQGIEHRLQAQFFCSDKVQLKITNAKLRGFDITHLSEA